MNDVVGYYSEIAQKKLSNCSTIAKIQTQGLDFLLKQGFPTRHDEDWKYSAPTAFLQERFASSQHTERNVPEPSLLSQQERSGYVLIQNGKVILDKHLPSGVRVMSLSEAVQDMPALWERYHHQLFPMEHGFHALNVALLETTLVMHVAVNTHLSLPMLWQYMQDQANQSVHAHCIVVLEEGASLHLIEAFRGAEDCVYLSNRVLELFLEPRSHLTHTLIQNESQHAYHLSHVFAHQTENSVFESHVINLGGKWVRSDQSLYLKGAHASCLLNGVYGLNQAQHMDHHTAVFHQSGGCESRQNYKGIVAGKSRAVFSGRVVVSPHAQKTQAFQQNKNLLLSEAAEVDTKPQLEIEANDVSCSHGATVGQLSEEALFYFASRGIPHELAMQFMISGFASENLALIPQPKLREALSSQLHAHLLGARNDHSA